MARFIAAALAAAYAVALASAQTISHEPCNKIRQHIRDGIEIPADVGYACLTSVPFYPEIGVKTVQNFKKWTEIHSTVGDLKNPPKEYFNPAVDLMAEFDALIAKIQDGGVDNQYQFEAEMASITFKSYDGHYSFLGPTFAAFRWRRGGGYNRNGEYSGSYGGALISVSPSEDGSELPEVFFHSDLRVDGDVSPIKKFNGVDVVEYITKEMEHQTFHDPDARWNTLFAREQAWSDGAWIFPYTYPGGNTTATFANGSSITLVNTATPNDDSAWFSVVDGETFYETFVAPVSSPSVGTVSSIPKRHPLLRRSEMINARTQDTKILEKRKVPPNYPAPVVQHSQVDTEIGAFFLDGEGLDDVAVLSMNTFDTDSGEAHIEFQALVEDFIALAKSEGKTKIIIDVSSNGGGSLFMGFDIFKQFFPELEPAIDNRFPVTDVNMILGEQMGTIDEKKTDMEFVWENGFTPYDAYFSHLHWASNTDENDKQYTSWDQMKGPVMLNDYPMSEVMRYNFSYPFHADGGIDDITGYGTRKNNNKQPFESENIVIVSDGYCSSTCSIFVDLMKNQGNVRTFALGGRPQFGPMQTVGGTKGAILTGWEEIASQVQTVLNFFGTASDRAKWAKKLPLAWPINMSGFSAPIANGRSAYHRGSDTPLQFLNETANCRLFYTPAMLQNVTNIWDTVARVAWDIEGGTGQKCVAGSETDGKPLGEIVSKKTPAGADIDGVDGDNSAAKEHDDDPEGAAPGGAAVCLFTLTFGLLVTGLAYL